MMADNGGCTRQHPRPRARGRSPNCVTAAHVVHESVCGGCGAEHVPRIPAVPGTSVGPDILPPAVDLYHNGMAVGPIADTLDGFFGAGFCKAAVQRAPEAAPIPALFSFPSGAVKQNIQAAF